MKLYELTHLFYRDGAAIISSPKNLGLFYAPEQAAAAKAHAMTQPGFREHPEAFSLRAREVAGPITNHRVYEALVYLHSENYEYETVIELGLFAQEEAARSCILQHCRDNPALIRAPGLIAETEPIEILVGKPEWTEGFIL